MIVPALWHQAPPSGGMHAHRMSAWPCRGCDWLCRPLGSISQKWSDTWGGLGGEVRGRIALLVGCLWIGVELSFESVLVTLVHITYFFVVTNIREIIYDR